MENKEVEKIDDQRLLLLVRALNWAVLNANEINKTAGEVLKELNYVMLDMQTQSKSPEMYHKILKVVSEMHRLIADTIEMASAGMEDGIEGNQEGIRGLQTMFLETIKKLGVFTEGKDGSTLML